MFRVALYGHNRNRISARVTPPDEKGASLLQLVQRANVPTTASENAEALFAVSRGAIIASDYDVPYLAICPFQTVCSILAIARAAIALDSRLGGHDHAATHGHCLFEEGRQLQVLVGLDVGDDDRGIVLHARFWHPVWAHPLHK